MQTLPVERTYTAFFLFGGLGGGALGAQWAAREFRGVQGKCEVLGSIDNDPDACADFEMWTGVPATVLDLFDREQYCDWHHGKEPPADWQEVTLEQIRAAAQNRNPDVVVVTAPCKGFSGLLSEDKSKSGRYQALNKLTFRGVFLALEAWRDNLPGVILFENVPRIATRGKKFLSEIKRLLQAYGYVIDDRHHNCGEHGLAQNRRRYLLIARQVDKVPHFVYNTPKLTVRPIGDVIEPMPMPDAPEAGPLHRLPRLQWRTWLRLALIPPGGDWRDLQGIEAGRYRITQEMNGKHTSKYRVYDSGLPAGTVTGSDRLGSGAPSVADVRLAEAEGRHNMKWRVQDESNPAATVIGQTDVQAGAPILADPRLNHTPMGNGKGGGAYHVQDVTDPGKTVTGDPDHRKSGGNGVIADPRINHSPRDASMRVGDTSAPSSPVVGHAGVTSSNGIGAIADPRVPPGFDGTHKVTPIDQPAPTVTTQGSPSGGSIVIADPRNLEHSATYGNMLRVTDASDPSNTVTGATGPNQAANLFADPRTPRFNNVQRVTDSDDPAQAVTGATGTSNAAGVVADHRYTREPRTGVYAVQDTAEPSRTVTAGKDPNGNMLHIADPGLACAPRNGTMGVTDMSDPAPSVVAASDIHNGGAGAVADHRLPDDAERGVWIIVSPHTDKKGRHCWHRPLTTLELLALQGGPTRMPDGSPVILAGKSDRAWRERIGNMLPPPSMKAIMEEVILSFMASEAETWAMDEHGAGIWVQPPEKEIETDLPA